MDENELRDALRTTVTLSPAPPPMDAAAAVATGRRAARRRGMLAGVCTAAALAAVVAAVPPARGLVGGVPLLAAGPGAGVATVAPHPTMPAPAATTKPTWPAGPDGRPQQDATARSGTRYEQGKHLLDEVLAVVPPGYSTPIGSTKGGIPLREHQAAVEQSSWGYLASVSIQQAGGTGRLLVEVHTRGNKLPTQPCTLARSFWGMGGTCAIQELGGKQVGVIVRPGSDDRFDQWSAYRYADGTVVYVAQARTATNFETTVPSLAALPLTLSQLAALAVDPRFHLS